MLGQRRKRLPALSPHRADMSRVYWIPCVIFPMVAYE